MYLEKLEVQGFKSFANKNKLIFSGLVEDGKRGLTAIVGPNGSGKSNVADAVRWALGEQSLKTLRGKKSEDIIFSGSDKKAQLSLAEVSLFLNNTDGIGKSAVKIKKSAPVEKAEKAEAAAGTDGELEKEEDSERSDLDELIATQPEIIITRRLYRSGESEYLLNNNRVRLSDIQMLLAKANFGQKTYSVIGQGMVENFLTTTAAERKDFFDEATGIKQFQIKRDSALNKLENSYENLQQVDMLLAEIKPRLKSLTRQVEKLKRRGEIESDLHSSQLNYYGWLWQDISQKLEAANSRLLGLEKTKLEKERKLDKLNEELNKIRATDNFREMNELQPRLRDLESQKNQTQKQLAKLQAEIELQLEAQGQFDVSWLENKRTELTAELENITLELNGFDNNADATEEKTILAELSAVQKEIASADALRRQANDLEEEKNRCLKQVAKFEAVLEANLEARGQFDVSWLENKRVELEEAGRKLESEISELLHSSRPENEEKARQELGAIQAELSRLNNELSDLKKELQKTPAKDGLNEEIAAAINDFLKKLDEIDAEDDLKKVKELIAAAKKDFQKRIKSTGNGPDDRWTRIKEIQEEIIRLTEKRQESNDKLNEERLRLSSANERRRLLEAAREQNARELLDIDKKLAESQVKFDADGLNADKQAVQKKISALEKEISSLLEQARTDSVQTKKAGLWDKLQNCRLRAGALAERRRLLSEKKEQLNREMSDIAGKLSKAQVKVDTGKLAADKKEIDGKLAGINDEIGQLEARLSELNAAREKEKAQMFECQQNIQAAQNETNEITSELGAIQVEVARQETKLEDLENNIRGDELEIGAVKDHRLTEEEVDLPRWQKRLNDCKNQLEQIGGIDPEAEKEYHETKERYDFLSAQTSDLNQAIKSLEEIIGELDANIKNRFDAEFKVISEKFNEYFQILFNGGRAQISKLMADESEKDGSAAAARIAAEAGTNGLSAAEEAIRQETHEKLSRIKFLRKHDSSGLAGIDVQATPPGKKIQTVTMLSGGERALTAIALICAIISANPSPFVILDEVDAALDEANSERLAKILDDLSNRTQFIVITHNRACMRRASILYGVTMESDGVSKLLSVKLDDLKK